MISIANESQMGCGLGSLTRVWGASKPQVVLGAGFRVLGFRGRILPRRKFKTGLPNYVHG
jgi:hypothetical protein